MALSPKELSEFVSKMMPEDMDSDPELSFRPAEARPQTVIMRAAQRSSRGATKMQVFSLDRPSADEVGKPGEEEPQIETPPTGPAGYGLLTLVGEGGFGEVWEAIQMSLGRIVAVKRMGRKLLREMKDDPSEMKKLEEDFQREALTTGLLEHPNIVPVHDLGLDEDGRPLLAMKMVRGERWDDLLYEDLTKQTPDDVLARHLPILIDVSQAVAFAHAKGIVHRDIKPSQVMVGEFGETLLMDWGIAVLYDPNLLDEDCKQLADEIAPTCDKAFNPTGTPAYMAPEQTTKTARQIGPWTDTYLLGGILYYLLTGRSPHSGKTSRESFTLAASGHVHPPHEAAPGREMPKELVEIAMKALSPRPADRYASVKDYIAALRDYMTGAGNRHRSMALTKDAATTVAKGMKGYEELTECHNRVLQAASLWPQNPMADSLLTKVRSAYAEEALRNGDLTLARLMAQQISDEALKGPLMVQLAAGEKRVKSSRTQKIVLYSLATLLLLVVMFMGIFGYLWQTNLGMQAQSNTVQAMKQRAEAAERRVAELQAALKEAGIAAEPAATPAPEPAPQ